MCVQLFWVTVQELSKFIHHPRVKTDFVSACSQTVLISFWNDWVVATFVYLPDRVWFDYILITQPKCPRSVPTTWGRGLVARVLFMPRCPLLEKGMWTTKQVLKARTVALSYWRYNQYVHTLCNSSVHTVHGICKAAYAKRFNEMYSRLTLHSFSYSLLTI